MILIKQKKYYQKINYYCHKLLSLNYYHIRSTKLLSHDSIIITSQLNYYQITQLNYYQITQLLSNHSIIINSIIITQLLLHHSNHSIIITPINYYHTITITFTLLNYYHTITIT